MRNRTHSRSIAPGFERQGLRPSSSGVVQSFCDARLEWLRGRKRHLLGERCKLLGLFGQRLDLLS